MSCRALVAGLMLAGLFALTPGADAATCTAANGGPWATAGSWSCHAVPAAGDAVVIPAGKTVTIAAGDEEEAGTVTLGGTLALADGDSSLDASDLIANGGTLRGPQSDVTVTLDPALVASVGASGLTVDGASLLVAGDGGLALAGPLTIIDGGWLESDVGTSWTGTAPWQLGGGDDPSVSSGFEEAGAQLTIGGATSAQTVAGAGDGVIQIDESATVSKQDATATTLAVDVLLDDSLVQVTAGKLIGGFQGNAALSLSSGAVMGLSGTALQLSSATVNAAGGTLEVEPGADVALDLPANPGLRLLSLGAGASLDVGVGVDDGPLGSELPVAMLASETALGAGSTLSIDGGGGTLALGDEDTLHGSGTLDATLANRGTLSPSGDLSVTGAFSQSAGGTLAFALHSASNADSLTVGGDVALAGALRVATGYSPAADASPLVLGAAAKPGGAFAKVVAPLAGGGSWAPVYGPQGVTLAVTGGGGGSITLARPSLRPRSLVVGGTASCVPPPSKTPQKVAYQWLRAGKPIRGATKARHRVGAADRGRALACRVTVGTGARLFSATSDAARARAVFAIDSATAQAGGHVAVAVRCAASEGRCSGRLRLVVEGRAVASGHFALHAPGGVVQIARTGSARIAGGAAVVRATYRNEAGATRVVTRRIALAG